MAWISSCKADWKGTIFEWVIKNFRLKTTHSPIFTDDSSKTDWHLIFHSNDEDDEVGLYLKYDGRADGEEIISVKYKFSIYDNTDRLIKQTPVGWFKVPNKSVYRGGLKIAHKMELMDLPDNRIKFEVDMVVSADIYNIGYGMSISRLQCGLTHILQKKKMCDFVLSVDGVDIDVHQVVMAAMSPVFQAMFDDDGVESIKRIEIKDFDLTTVRRSVEFIYSGNVLGFEVLQSEEVFALFRIADKYGIEDLKMLTVNHLLWTIDRNNVVKVLMFADANEVVPLRKKCLHLLFFNAEKIGELDAKRELINLPDVLYEIVSKLASGFICPQFLIEFTTVE